MACLDTSTLLDLSGRGGARSKSLVRSKLRALVESGETLATTVFNLAELQVGVERARDRDSEEAKVEALVEPLAILEFDDRTIEAFGRVVAFLQVRGTPIGDMDALIAAVCLVSGHGIVTRNTEPFARVPGLIVESY